MNKQMHSKQAGFTLIELVIVIIILGILAATAVPKFIDLQGDARGSALKGVKAALEGAASLTYSRAAIKGTEKEATDSVDDIATVYGYPAYTELKEVAELSTTDWTIDASGTGVSGAVITAFGAASGSTSTCKVTYANAASSVARPTITVDESGC